MNYIEFLKQELIPAFGCTEPIALAYCSAKAREVLGKYPTKIYAHLSGNIIKNANSVSVPGTDGRKGINISIVAGAFLGNPKLELEVLSKIEKKKLNFCDELIKKNILDVSLKKDVANLYIEIIMFSNNDKARVIIETSHTNITLIEKNDIIIFKKEKSDEKSENVKLDFDSIYNFSKTCDYSELKNLLDTEIIYNLSISKEGITNNWGSNIGKTILKNSNDNYYEKLTAYAASGSDARMSGCELPVIINSGSGNQGITVSVPVIIYCQDNNIDKDKLYRGLIFSNLIGLYLKQKIGKLSAYCGVVPAACASVCGIGFIQNIQKELLMEILSNGLAVNSGIICDGAKASCAGKIASSLRNAFLGYEQALSQNSYKIGDGIIGNSLERTIETVGCIASLGMKITDEVILTEMLKNKKSSNF